MLGIIQAFMHDPDLVVMDEPTSGLACAVQGAKPPRLRSRSKTSDFRTAPQSAQADKKRALSHGTTPSRH